MIVHRAKYRFGKTLGAGTYGVVREAEGPTGRVAVKIILKKNVKGNERMVYDELRMLQTLKHPHIVKFVDWFESRVIPCFSYCCRQLSQADFDWDRINSTSSPSLPPAVSCLTVFASRESLPRRTLHRPSNRC